MINNKKIKNMFFNILYTKYYNNYYDSISFKT